MEAYSEPDRYKVPNYSMFCLNNGFASTVTMLIILVFPNFMTSIGNKKRVITEVEGTSKRCH